AAMNAAGNKDGAAEKAPGRTSPAESSGGQDDQPGESATSGGPAANADPADRARPKDADVGARSPEFTESGRATGGPLTDRQLAQTVGAELRKLDRALRDGQVEAKLLKDLGWTEADVQQFVSRYADR